MVIKKLLIEQRRTLMMLCGGYLGMCVLIGLWFGLFGARVGQEGFILYIFLSGLACAIVASKMFFDMTSKEGRVSLLMTPATAAQKFMPRLAAILPGMLVLVALGYIVLGLSDMVMIRINYGMWGSFYNPFASSSPDLGLLIFSLSAMFLFNESIFIYGSVAWPRKSFLKSLGVFALIQIVFSFISSAVLKTMIAHGMAFEIVNGEALAWTIANCIVVAAVAIIWGAYIKFKRSTVI